jgi:hypothetical protein
MLSYTSVVQCTDLNRLSRLSSASFAKSENILAYSGSQRAVRVLAKLQILWPIIRGLVTDREKIHFASPQHSH